MLNKEQLRENIISLLGIQKLPDAQKLALLNKMSDLAQKRITLRILEQLDGKEQEEFLTASENNDEEKIKEILNNKNIDVATLAGEEVEKLKAELKGVVDKLEV